MDENFSAVEEQVIDVATGRDILGNRTWELLNAAAKYLGHFFGTDCLPNLHAAFPGAGNTRGGQRRPRWPHHGKTKRNIVWKYPRRRASRVAAAQLPLPPVRQRRHHTHFSFN